MNEIPHPGFDKPEEYETFTTTNDLDKATEISFDEADALGQDYMNFLAKGLTENYPRPIGPHWFCEYAKKRFIAGANWQKKQMMNNVVEGTIICYNDETYSVESCCFDNKEHHHHSGDKVRIIVLPKEDEE